MADGNGVPMFGPDGQVHLVPNDQVSAAQSNGGELAHQMKAPDGSLRYVRHSQLGDALRAGGVPVAASQQITNNSGLAGVARPNIQPESMTIGDALIPDTRSAADVKYGVPGSFEGHPENIGQYVPATVGRAAEGAVDMSRGNVAMGGRKMIQAVGNAVAPMAPVLAAGAPLATAKALIGGGIASGVTNKTASALGASPDQAALSGDIAGVLGGGLATKLRMGNPLSTEEYGTLFNQVRQAAGNIPVDVSAPGNTALEIQRLGTTGGRVPKVINDFVRRTTDPDKPPLTFAEARDFYQNASRLSANEAQSLNPVQHRQMAIFTKNLGNALNDAAAKGGVLPEYLQAMQGFAKAKSLQGKWDDLAPELVKGLIKGIGLSGGGYAAYKVLSDH